VKRRCIIQALIKGLAPPSAMMGDDGRERAFDFVSLAAGGVCGRGGGGIHNGEVSLHR